MPRIETFAVTQRGVGRPDYSQNVALGKQRSGYQLEEGETLKQFYLVFTTHAVVGNPYSWIFDPLAIGGNAHFIDSATGLALPYTIPQDYTLKFVETGSSTSQDMELWTSFEIRPGVLDLVACAGILAAGHPINVNQVVPYDSALLDPTGASSHQIDTVLYNTGGAVLTGGFAISAILKEVGTPPLPDKKTVRCKHCGHQQEVDCRATVVVCSKCGQINVYGNDRGPAPRREG